MSEFNLEFVEEYIDTSRRCTRPIELRDALLRHISRLGFDKLSALNIQAVPSVMEGRDDTDTKFIRIGNYPAAWYKRFFEKSYYRIDPVCENLKTATAPFFWHDPEVYSDDLGAEEIRLLDQFNAEAGEVDLLNGITIPIDNVESRSCISFCGKEAQNSPGVMQMMHLIGIYFQQRLLLLEKSYNERRRHLPSMTGVRLTARETEVLRWYAQGKSAWDISEILGVSERTIRFHMAGVRNKYGVSSSVYATALAISNNHIVL